MPENDPIIHLIDDDEAVRRALSFLLGTAGLAVKVYESGQHFLDSLDKALPGCIVTDVRMPGISGLDLMHRLKEKSLIMPVIVMTGHADVPLAVEAMKAGAADFIEKPFPDEVLLASIRNALDRFGKQNSAMAEREQIRSRLAALSLREGQVLDGLVAGNSNKVIAGHLDISPRTVEVHRANVMTKMAVSSLSELVRLVLLARE